MNRESIDRKTNIQYEPRKEKSIMKRIFTLIIAMLMTTTITVGAAEIPQYSVPIIATQESVEIVENRALARMLYSNVEIDQEIPPELYQAVAEVLAYVYKIRNHS